MDFKTQIIKLRSALVQHKWPLIYFGLLVFGLCFHTTKHWCLFGMLCGGIYPLYYRPRSAFMKRSLLFCLLLAGGVLFMDMLLKESLVSCLSLLLFAILLVVALFWWGVACFLSGRFNTPCRVGLAFAYLAALIGFFAQKPVLYMLLLFLGVSINESRIGFMYDSLRWYGLPPGSTLVRDYTTIGHSKNGHGHCEYMISRIIRLKPKTELAEIERFYDHKPVYVPFYERWQIGTDEACEWGTKGAGAIKKACIYVIATEPCGSDAHEFGNGDCLGIADRKEYPPDTIFAKVALLVQKTSEYRDLRCD